MTISASGALDDSERIGRRENPSTRAPGDPVAQVRRLLETAVEEHLLADVPVASFLSGGIDSSIVTALAARAMDDETANILRRLRDGGVR